jgi:hypothetical protein
MPLNDIYMLTLIQEWGTGGKRMNNVFFYEHTAGEDNHVGLGFAFATQILPDINSLQCNIVRNYSVNVVNLGDLGDFGDTVVSGGGLYEEQSLPIADAIGYTTKLNTRAVRHGGKRFSGIPESVQANGIVTVSGYLTYMETVRGHLMNELTAIGDTWLPVVIKRVREEIPGTVPQQYTYRLPETDGELVIGEIVAAYTSPKISHQVSRSK